MMHRAYVIAGDGDGAFHAEWLPALSDAFLKAEELKDDPRAKIVVVFDGVVGEWVKDSRTRTELEQAEAEFARQEQLA